MLVSTTLGTMIYLKKSMENFNKDQLSSLSDDIFVKMKNSEDRLSSLSDDILLKILSLLPIKTAVATSLLCRRWISLWTHITAFRLHEPRLSIFIDEESGTTTDHTPSNLTSIVDNLLPKLISPVISTFTLIIDSHTHTNPDSIDSWIRFICSRYVQYFKLICRSNYTYQSLSCLFQCCSLVSLSLNCIGSLSDAESVEINLPNLKILYIGSLGDSKETFMAKLFKSCPRLEELRIYGYLWHPGIELGPYRKREFPVFISGQYLRLFSIRFDHFDSYDNVVVYIDAPNLQVFKVHDISYLQFRFINKPIGLLKAKLNSGLYDTLIRDNMGWFQVISGVSELKIGEYALDNIFNIQDYQIPVFSNLTKLVTSVSTIYGWKTDFFRLLECTPNLEFLNIELLFSSCFKNEAADHTNVFPQALSAPSCLLHRVKKIEFQITGILRCRCQDLELEVVKYMLIHASALKELVIKVCCIGLVRNYELQLHEELELYHLYETLRNLPRNLGIHCSVTLKFVLRYGVTRLVFPHQMEYEDGWANCSPSHNPKDYYSAPPITLKESFST